MLQVVSIESIIPNNTKTDRWKSKDLMILKMLY